MHQHRHANWAHDHQFFSPNKSGETRTQWVLLLTLITMVVEIIAGMVFGSMALLADGWHMGTHAAAFGITLYTYAYARKNSNNDRFSFGTGKVGILGGFASAIALAMVALMMAIESIMRLVEPNEIKFDEAIFVAVIGLIVNIVSAFILKDHHHDHHHGHSHSHDDHQADHHHDSEHATEPHKHHDVNLKAAYFHVLADALTSLLAIGALILGKYLGWASLDSIMGVVGAIIIIRWAFSLLKETSTILLDHNSDTALEMSIKHKIESDSDAEVVDLHVWAVSTGQFAAIISLVTESPKSPDYYKALLLPSSALVHISVEINICDGDECLPKTI